MDLSLPADVVEYLNLAVAKGTFANHAEAISVAVRSLQASEWHREAVLEGLAQIERGEYEDYDETSLDTLVDNVEQMGQKALAARKNAS